MGYRKGRGFLFLFICFGLLYAGPSQYSWQKKHVEITPTGDFEWKPEPFQFNPGPSKRYIDFENGNDNNNGTSPQTAWKHHPWDPEATGRAKDASGTHTYVFKRGVTYRGVLVADESGTVENPIQLTSDPGYGSGEARFYGSEPITGGWQQGGHADMPEAANVWYKDLPFAPLHVYVVDDENITSLVMARTPNWKVVTTDDVNSEWWLWERTGPQMVDGKKVTTMIDKKNLTRSADYYKDAIIWTEWRGPTQGNPWAYKPLSYDAATQSFKIHDLSYGSFGTFASVKPKNRYFLENKPHYLDTPGEFWVEKTGTGSRLYVRLPNDQNPNNAHIEVPKYLNFISLDNQGDISISGISFRFTNLYWEYWSTLAAGADNITNSVIKKNQGPGANITIKNCQFEHVTQAIRIDALTGTEMDSILITDNIIRHTDHAAIFVKGREHVRLFRNSIYNIMFRSYTGAHGHGVDLKNNVDIEVAGNILERSYGSGFFVEVPKKRPFVRCLMYQNKAIKTLLSNSDWAGIQCNDGGPAYVFNNISGDPSGYWHDRKGTFGFPYYFDGDASKKYMFNCVAWGITDNDTIRSNAGLMQVWGVENSVFNNTFYNFEIGSRRQSPQGQRNIYIGNIYMDMTKWMFFHNKSDQLADENAPHLWGQDTNYDYATEAFSKNIFYQKPEKFGVFEYNRLYYETLQNFSTALEKYAVLKWDVGAYVNDEPVVNAKARDFRLKSNSPAINKGARVFVPWSLYMMVGEWHFRLCNKDPKRIIDNHYYQAPYWGNRVTHSFMPKYPFTTVNVTVNDFVESPLDNWTKSAVKFNGQNQYAVCTNEHIKKDVPYPLNDGSGRNGFIPASRKVTPDMDDNSFLIEVYLKVNPGHKGGLIIGKAAAAGYVLEVDQAGKARLILRSGGADAAKRSSAAAINDGKWHHVIAEVDRSAAQGITMYIDGKVSNAAFEGTMPTGSISNDADLSVGGGPGKTHFAGVIDYMRVSRGTLADAETTIEELYAWQFDGPQFYDLMGNEIKDGHRDAGAFEGESTYVSVANKIAPITIGKATKQTVATLKAAAEQGMHNGIASDAIAKNTIPQQDLHADSVEILLNNGTSKMTDTFNVPSGGVYEFTISCEKPGVFQLEEVGKNRKVVANVDVNKTRSVRVNLMEKMIYTYSIDAPAESRTGACKITWRLLP